MVGEAMTRTFFSSAFMFSRVFLILITSVLLCDRLLAQDPPAAETGAVPAESGTASETSTATETRPGDGTAGATASTVQPATPAQTLDAANVPKVVPFGSQPYAVLVDVAFDGRAGDSAEFREEVIGDIRETVLRMYGRTWAANVEQSLWLVPGQQSRLARLQPTELVDRYPEQQIQKAFLLTIEADGYSVFRVSCREYDSRVQELTPVYDETTYDVRSIGTIAARLMRDAFRPVVVFVRQFEREEDGQAMMELQVQAGEIIPPDPSAAQIVEGDVLRPFLRTMDRRDPLKLKQLQTLPLSYIRIMEVDREVTRGLVNGVFVSHMARSPFGGKGRRLQHLALRQRPTAEQSKVQLVLQSRPDKPLIAHRLSIAYQLGYKDAEDGPQTQLVSDRNGEVVIQRRDNHPTFWIRVYSGTSLLARVPYAPGLLPFDTIALPDDAIRLRVEGELQLLQDELIDAIAVREVLIARAKKAAEKGDRSLVDQLLTHYASVPSGEQFVTKISNIQIPASKEAKARGQGDTRIIQACRKLQDTVSTFFTEEKRAERQAEMEKIRNLAEQHEGRGNLPASE